MTDVKSSIEYRIVDLIGDKASFDIAEFLQRMTEGYDWIKLIVTHIYLDHIVTETLKDQLPDPAAYLKGHKPFIDKLNICQALGYFEGEFGGLLKAVNTARNRFAHKLIFDVTEEEKKNLFRLFTTARPLTEVTRPEGFEDFLIIVVLLAEVERVVEKKRTHLSQEMSELMDGLLTLLSEKKAEDEDAP